MTAFFRPIRALALAALASITTAHAAAHDPLPGDDTFARLHAVSEAIYDGAGSWGSRLHGYRMPLRDVAWRAEVYAELAQRGNGPLVPIYRQRAIEAAEHLLAAQAQGGTGVFGFPADVQNPEFGAIVRSALRSCSSCASGGWIVMLPERHVSELYYDHGHALAALVRVHQLTGDAALLAAARRAADWALDKPLVANVNYLSSLSIGLSSAWRATGDARYLDKAVDLHRRGILPFIGHSGDAKDPHNAKLEYHGFIVSGLAALHAALPERHDYRDAIARALDATTARMAARGLQEPGAYGATWPGTNLAAWHRVASLRPLRPDEAQARDRARALVRAALPRIEGERDAFRLRKALYSYFAVGLW